MKCPACDNEVLTEFSHFNHAWTCKLIDLDKLLIEIDALAHLSACHGYVLKTALVAALKDLRGKQ